MKIWAKLVACFLIAWMPFLGYPAQAAFCPAMSSVVAAHQDMQTSHISSLAACEQGSRHQSVHTQPACHGGMGGAVCGVPVIPERYTVINVPSSPVYRAVVHCLTAQFIPELPAPPPRLL
ncbi:hypothetical protein [Paraburkholderia tagetis]|uniref:Uncharacterized protein n=1 Tax=Paraburkholderia tagetis TaxID=2913261 RepID=A0A9X1ZYT5_9BURK|nr:hypothetical protein [Paraburkholderia tagetis]MCG5078527.1 hypothetical protein [Paraburkholderia tagetis]